MELSKVILGQFPQGTKFKQTILVLVQVQSMKVSTFY